MTGTECHDCGTPTDYREADEAGRGAVGQERNCAKVHRPGNPFRERAIRARAKADKLSGRRTAHEQGMANSFPLGAGYGRAGGAKRIERSIDRAVAAVKANEDALWLESSADAYDQGRINAQGRRWDAHKQAMSEKREATKAKRDARIAEARAIVDSKPRHEVDCDTWATAQGYMAGPGRELIKHDQSEYIKANTTTP